MSDELAEIVDDSGEVDGAGGMGSDDFEEMWGVDPETDDFVADLMEAYGGSDELFGEDSFLSDFEEAQEVLDELGEDYDFEDVLDEMDWGG